MQVFPCRDPSPDLFAQAVRSARGEFPADILALHGTNLVGSDSHQSVPAAGPDYDPELHILDAEWYFSASAIATISLLIRGESVCLLGTPKLANEIATRFAEVVLVDKNPLIGDRFPLLTGRIHIKTADIWDSELKSSFDSVVLDPPWYFPEFWVWLDVARRAVGGAGRLIMPLLGEGTRPSAQTDRQALLRFLSARGRVSVLPSAVEYEVPLFERRALASAGIHLNRPWRLADLIVADLDNRSAEDIHGSFGKQLQMDVDWQTFVIGSQVVKVRETGNRQDGFIGPVPGVQNFAYDSVSRRDSRWSSIDLWTSRNRVATVLDHARVRQALGALEGPSGSLAERVSTLRSRVGSAADILLFVLEVGE